jgi:hypothetical protein
VVKCLMFILWTTVSSPVEQGAANLGCCTQWLDGQSLPQRPSAPIPVIVIQCKQHQGDGYWLMKM